MYSTAQLLKYKSIPVIIGIGVVTSTIIFLLCRKKKCHKTLNDPTLKVPLTLLEKEEISHDTRRFRFKLPSSNHVLGLPIGQHIFLSAEIDGEAVIRSYTPVTSDDNLGYMDLVIKVYKRGVHPKFPAGGKMSQYLDELSIGDSVDVRGPAGRLKYLGKGTFSIKWMRKNSPTILHAKKLNMIAGGTGITPMLQLIRDITKDESDSTSMSLIFANQSEQDILLRHELEAVAVKHPDQFKIWYTIDNPTPDWKFGMGFVSEIMITEHLFPPSADTLTLMCGPPPMINFACNPNLSKLGYQSELCFSY